MPFSMRNALEGRLLKVSFAHLVAQSGMSAIGPRVAGRQSALNPNIQEFGVATWKLPFVQTPDGDSEASYIQLRFIKTRLR